MKIFIAGLGLIGGSYAEGLTQNGYEVYGYNRTKESELIAIERSYIKDAGLKYLPLCEVVILGFYPQLNVTFLNEHKHLLKPGQIITDVAGTKVEMIPQIEAILPKGVSYVSHHPMAGRETRGIERADCNMFKGANFLITPSAHSTIESIEVIKQLGRDLAFKKITIIDPKRHDQLIGFTSQLPHAMAVALVNSDAYDETSSFTGDSFRDLTRIAMINEVLWTELFFENKTILIDEIEKFERELDKIKQALNDNDKVSLANLFIQSTKKRSGF
ncbi:MAG: prephenate dehydrogenase [Acholeplasma sp.]|jgi:prephenate dehydrogenase|nr:prephenate dehydrogenase [Acholeplasma sp.]